MDTPPAILPRAAHSHRYRDSLVTAGNVPPRIATPHTAVLEFADGSGATATLPQPDDDALVRAVDAYMTQKRHPVVARRWLLRPVDTTRTAWRVARRLPAASCRQRRVRREPRASAKIRRLGIHDEQAF